MARRDEISEYPETFKAMGMTPTADDLDAAGFTQTEIDNYDSSLINNALEDSGTTVFGKPVYTDEDGQYSERTETVPLGTEYIVRPTVDPATGAEYDKDLLDAYYKSEGVVDPYTGEDGQSFDSEEDANKYAEFRSDNQFNSQLLDKDYWNKESGLDYTSSYNEAEASAYEPTLRQKGTDWLSNTLQGILGMENYDANKLSRKVMGDENPTDGGMGLGLADLTGAGMVFGGQEAKRDFTRARNTDDKLGMGIAVAEGALSVAEALPLTGTMVKGTKKLIQDLVDGGLMPEYDQSMVGSNLGNLFNSPKSSAVKPNFMDYNSATVKKLDDAFNNQRDEIVVGATSKNAAKLGNIPEAGSRVGLRPNLNSKIPNNPTGNPRGTQLVTVHGPATKNNPIGQVESYLPYATARNVVFYVNQTKRVQIGSHLNDLPVPEATNKNPAMSIDGEFDPDANVLLDPDQANVVEIMLNPKDQHLFVDVENNYAVESAEIATQIGNRVYAKGVKYMDEANAPTALPASDGTELPNVVKFKSSDEIAAEDQTDELLAMGHNQGPPLETTMANVINARANEMKKPVGKRTGSSGKPLFDTSPQAYERNTVAQEEIYVPRNPNPDAKLPLGDRSRSVQDMSEEIAEVLAKRMEKWKGTAAQYFYNTEPIREKALAMGYSKEYVDEWMKEFSEAYAATSPRTDTAQNLRNASLVMSKKEAGVPLEELIGPGTGGISEKGYNMMTSDSGIHRILTDQVEAGGINPDNNTKPFTFAKNVEGNLQGATIDTHAIRGALDAMNEISPGSIPDGWIEPKWLEAYKEDPSKLNAVTWLKDTLGKQQIDGTAMQTEYAVFSDIYRLAGEKAKVSPAEAQSMGWFGSGEKTGLKSETATVVELVDERIGVTANVMGFSREEIFRMLMDRKIPLLSVLGGTTAMGALANNPGGEASVPGLMAEET